jgi:hypothetical protein
VEDDSYDGENDSRRGKPAGRGKAPSKGQPVEDDSYDGDSPPQKPAGREKASSKGQLSNEYNDSSI